MAISIGPRIGVQGEKEFRAVLREMVAESQRLGSEMDRLTQQFTRNDEALQRNKEINKSLEAQIKTQSDILAQNNNVLKEAEKKYTLQVHKIEEFKTAIRKVSDDLRDAKSDLPGLTSEYERVGRNLAVLKEEFGEAHPYTVEAQNDYNKLGKEISQAESEINALQKTVEEAPKKLSDMNASLHRDGQWVEQWKNEVVKADMKLYDLQKDLAKGANYVEKFGEESERTKEKIERETKAISVLDSEIAVSESEHKKWIEQLKLSAEKTDLIKKKIEEEKKIIQDNTKLRDAAIEAEKKQRAELERLEKALEKSKDETGEASRQTKQLTDAVEKQKDLVHEAATNTAEYTQQVNEAKVAQNELEEELKNSSGFHTLGGMMETAGEKMAEFGELMTKYVTTPLTALGTYAIKAAADFEDGMAKIYTIAIDGAEPMEKMRDELVQLSNDTGFSLDDLAEATYQTVSASVDATEAVDFMTQATKLARAGFTTTTKSVDVLTTIMNSYGKEAYDVGYISDVLLKTQNDGKLIIDELASSLGIIIPMASNYGVGLEQIAAAYATMTKQGVPAQKATTFLRAVFTELEKESSDVAEILENKTGKSFAQLMKSGNDLSDVLRILYNHAGNDTEAFQRLFGNVRATQAVASLVTDDFGILDYELQRVKDSAGQTDKALEVMETPALQARRAVNRLKNSAEDLGESMINMLLPTFADTVDSVKELSDGFINMSDDSKEFIIKAGALAAAIGPVAVITGKLVKYVGGLIIGTSSIVPVVGAVTAGVIALSTALAVQNRERTEAIRNEYGLTDAMKDNIAAVQAMSGDHKEFALAMQDRNTATVNQVAYIQELVGQYDALVGADGNVSEKNQELAEYILGELASALGLEVSQVQTLVDENGKLSGSIQQTVEDYKKQAFAAALKEQISEATHRLVQAEQLEKDLTEQLAEATQKQTDAHRKAEDAKKAYDEAVRTGAKDVEKLKQDYYDAAAAEELTNKSTKDLKNALWLARDEYSKASNDVDYLTERMTNLDEESKKTANQIEKDAKRSEKAVSDASSNVIISLDGAAKSAYKSGEMLARGFANGIDDYAYLAGQSSTNMGANASRKLNNSVQVKSPSRVAMETGKYFAEGFANGIESGIPMASEMAERLGMGATDGLTYGSYVPEGSVGSNVWNTSKTVNAPISLNVTVNGSVDDPDSFAKDIANRLTNLINRESEVFA